MIVDYNDNDNAKTFVLMNSDDFYVDVVKMIMMKWCLCDDYHEVWWRSNRYDDVDDMKMLLMNFNEDD